MEHQIKSCANVLMGYGSYSHRRTPWRRILPVFPCLLLQTFHLRNNLPRDNNYYSSHRLPRMFAQGRGLWRVQVPAFAAISRIASRTETISSSVLLCPMLMRTRPICNVPPTRCASGEQWSPARAVRSPPLLPPIPTLLPHPVPRCPGYWEYPPHNGQAVPGVGPGKKNLPRSHPP